MLDDWLRVPGTNARVGLDALFGLLPGLGDAVGAACSGYILLLAARHGAPTSLLLRMLTNVAVDGALGSVPLLGDLFDAGYKANVRNAALFEAHLARPAETRRRSRGIVALLIAASILLVLGASVLGIALVRWVVSAIR